VMGDVAKRSCTHMWGFGGCCALGWGAATIATLQALLQAAPRAASIACNAHPKRTARSDFAQSPLSIHLPLFRLSAPPCRPPKSIPYPTPQPLVSNRAAAKLVSAVVAAYPDALPEIYGR
jgi:hypothetical protein